MLKMVTVTSSNFIVFMNSIRQNLSISRQTTQTACLKQTFRLSHTAFIKTASVLKSITTVFCLLTEPGEDIDWDNEAAILSNLTCVAIAGIEDPVRDEVWLTWIRIYY